MQGSVYQGTVVRTKTVAAGEGVTTGVQVSEIVFESEKFVAQTDEQARGIILAKALNHVKTLDIASPVTPVEVRLSKS